MGLFDKLRNEFVDIVEWIDDSRHTLIWRFPRYHNQIKQGAELIVRPGQQAIFVSQGKVADIFEPGRYQLKTGNLPVLATLQGWKHGFDSPIKSEVYFVSKRPITDLKWGTPNPVIMRDPEFGAIRLRAFGNFTLRAMDSKIMLQELVGADSDFSADEITVLLKSIIVTAFSEILAQSEISALDLSANYMQFAESLREKVATMIDDEYGLAIDQLQIVNISFPESVEKALDTRTSMGIVGDMQKYQQYQLGQAMAGTGGQIGNSAAGEGLGLGMGMLMAGQMMQQPQMTANISAGDNQPPPLQASGPFYHVAIAGKAQGPFPLTQIQQMIQSGQINRETKVWTAGMKNWQPAESADTIKDFFTAPPPLP